jgi:hypothetical protein
MKRHDRFPTGFRIFVKFLGEFRKLGQQGTVIVVSKKASEECLHRVPVDKNNLILQKDMNGSGDSTMLLVVASMGFACMISSAAAGYLYYNGKLCTWLGEEMTFLCSGDAESSSTPAPTTAADETTAPAESSGSGGSGGSSSSNKKKCLKKCKSKKGEEKKKCEKKCKK